MGAVVGPRRYVFPDDNTLTINGNATTVLTAGTGQQIEGDAFNDSASTLDLQGPNAGLIARNARFETQGLQSSGVTGTDIGYDMDSCVISIDGQNNVVANYQLNGTNNFNNCTYIKAQAGGLNYFGNFSEGVRLDNITSFTNGRIICTDGTLSILTARLSPASSFAGSQFFGTVSTELVGGFGFAGVIFPAPGVTTAVPGVDSGKTWVVRHTQHNTDGIAGSNPSTSNNIDPVTPGLPNNIYTPMNGVDFSTGNGGIQINRGSANWYINPIPQFTNNVAQNITVTNHSGNPPTDTLQSAAEIRTFIGWNPRMRDIENNNIVGDAVVSGLSSRSSGIIVVPNTTDFFANIEGVAANGANPDFPEFTTLTEFDLDNDITNGLWIEDTRTLLTTNGTLPDVEPLQNRAYNIHSYTHTGTNVNTAIPTRSVVIGDETTQDIIGSEQNGLTNFVEQPILWAADTALNGVTYNSAVLQVSSSTNIYPNIKRSHYDGRIVEDFEPTIVNGVFTSAKELTLGTANGYSITGGGAGLGTLSIFAGGTITGNSIVTGINAPIDIDSTALTSLTMFNELTNLGNTTSCTLNPSSNTTIAANSIHNNTVFNQPSNANGNYSIGRFTGITGGSMNGIINGLVDSPTWRDFNLGDTTIGTVENATWTNVTSSDDINYDGRASLTNCTLSGTSSIISTTDNPVLDGNTFNNITSSFSSGTLVISGGSITGNITVANGLTALTLDGADASAATLASAGNGRTINIINGATAPANLNGWVEPAQPPVTHPINVTIPTNSSGFLTVRNTDAGTNVNYTITAGVISPTLPGILDDDNTNYRISYKLDSSVGGSVYRLRTVDVQLPQAPIVVEPIEVNSFFTGNATAENGISGNLLAVTGSVNSGNPARYDFTWSDTSSANPAGGNATQGVMVVGANLQSYFNFLVANQYINDPVDYRPGAVVWNDDADGAQLDAAIPAADGIFNISVNNATGNFISNSGGGLKTDNTTVAGVGQVQSSDEGAASLATVNNSISGLFAASSGVSETAFNEGINELKANHEVINTNAVNGILRGGVRAGAAANVPNQAE